LLIRELFEDNKNYKNASNSEHGAIDVANFTRINWIDLQAA